MSKFRVKIKKRVFIEGEPGTNCRNYPNSEFNSYQECDNKYMRRKVDYVAPGLNLTPVWMTRDLSKVTTKPVMVSLQLALSINLAQHLYRLYHLIPGVLEYQWNGVDKSDRQFPCETL